MIVMCTGMTYHSSALAVPSNVISAVGLILINKRVIQLDKYPFTTVLAVLHSYSTFMFCFLLVMLGHIKYKNVSNYGHLLRISCGSLVSILFMNLNLATNSVGFYQISKLACIPMTLAIESYLGMSQQMLTPVLLLSLSALLAGMALVAVTDISTSAVGFLWAFLGSLSTSVAQVLFGPLQRGLQLDPLQLLFHTTPWLTLGAFLSVPLTEDVREMADHTVSCAVVLDLLASCACAILLNMTNYMVLSTTSPLTYQVIGHIKTIAIISFGMVFYDEGPSSKMLLGIALAVLGVVLYTEENRQQQLRRGGKKILPVSVSAATAFPAPASTPDADSHSSHQLK